MEVRSVFEDEIYGNTEISEPVLCDLLSSDALQRLKGVSQIGANQFLQRGDFSRFEHSVGVCILLKRFNAPLEEQIMGLIHDISHPAFSHVADFVFGTEKNEDFHENMFREKLFESAIPKILIQHGFDPEDFLEAERYPLLEQPIPELCGDRIDYFLRHLVHEYQETETGKRLFLSVRFDSEKGFFITDPYSGKEFTKWFLQLNREIFCDAKMVGVSAILGRAIQRGLELRVLDKKNLWETDEAVLNRLKKSTDLQIQTDLKRVLNGVTITETDQNPDFVRPKKSRFIDPWVRLPDKSFERVSVVFPEVADLIQVEKERQNRLRGFKIS